MNITLCVQPLPSQQKGKFWLKIKEHCNQSRIFYCAHIKRRKGRHCVFSSLRELSTTRKKRSSETETESQAKQRAKRVTLTRTSVTKLTEKKASQTRQGEFHRRVRSGWRIRKSWNWENRYDPLNRGSRSPHFRALLFNKSYGIVCKLPPASLLSQ